VTDSAVAPTCTKAGLTEGKEQGKAEAYGEIQDLNAELEQTLYGTDTGGKSYYDEWWDLRQNYGNEEGVNYEYAFYMFPNELFNPKYDFIFGTDYSANSTFSYSTITDIQKDCYFSMPNPSVYGANSIFARCKKLVNARTLHCPSGLKWNNYAFRECESLVEIRFAGVIDTDSLNLQWSTKLSHDSLMSIINTLKDNRGTDTWNTITLGAENLAKLSVEELNIMQNKQWEYA
jgi:hypothetical protein